MKTRLDQLLSTHEALLEELDIPGLELNFRSHLEIAKGNEDCDFGLYGLMTYGSTGRAHIVMIPQLGSPLEEWPVAFFDANHGTAYTFSASIKTWFPAYFIYRANEWYPVYLKYGSEMSWAQEALESCRENKKKIVAQGRKCMDDFDGFYEDFLDLVENKGEWKIKDWLQRIEPGGFLTRYHELKSRSTPLEQWKEYIFQYPFFSKPLFEQLSTNAIQHEGKAPDLDLCWTFWDRFWKCDMPYHKVLGPVVKAIAKKSPETDSPYFPLIKQVHAALAQDEHGYYEGALGLFSVGKAFEKRKEHARAIRCFENAILLRRAEDEVYFEEAHRRIVINAKKVAHGDYLAYLEATNEPG